MTAKILLAIFAAVAIVAGVATAQAPAANPKVLLKTSLGDITLELYPSKAPVTVQNFLTYVNDKFYDGTIFHRVIPGFMIQGGGLTADLREKPARAAIKNEAGNGLKNDRGWIAMARFTELDTATSEFFINLVNNNRLDDMKYAVFGKVIAGLDVVDAIAKVQTGNRRGRQNVPVEPVTLITATVVK